jgi:hypothetical protein
VFALGEPQNKREGSILVLIIVMLTIGGVLAANMSYRFRTSLQIYKQTEFQRSRRAWGAAIAERIDCMRTLAPHNLSNRCPAGTSKTLAFAGEPPLAVGSPDQSSPLNSEWFAKTECGPTGLRVRVVNYTNSSYFIDPVTKQLRNFTDPSSDVTREPEAAPLCSSYFGIGEPPARLYSMNIETLQKEATFRDADGKLTDINLTCDAKLGLIARVDDLQLDPLFQKSGSTTQLNNYSKFIKTNFRNLYNSWGLTANLDPNWNHMPQFSQMMGVNHCKRFCIDKKGAKTGVISKCDRSAPETPNPSDIIPDTTNYQAVCLCIR